MNAKEMLDTAIEFYERSDTGLGWLNPLSPTHPGRCVHYAGENRRSPIGCLLEPEAAIALDYWTEKLNRTDIFCKRSWRGYRYEMPQAFANLLPEDLEEGWNFQFMYCLHKVHDEVIWEKQARPTTKDIFLEAISHQKSYGKFIKPVPAEGVQIVKLEKLVQQKREKLEDLLKQGAI